MKYCIELNRQLSRRYYVTDGLMAGCVLRVTLSVFYKNLSIMQLRYPEQRLAEG